MSSDPELAVTPNPIQLSTSQMPSVRKRSRTGCWTCKYVDLGRYCMNGLGLRIAENGAYVVMKNVLHARSVHPQVDGVTAFRMFSLTRGPSPYPWL